MHLGSRRLAVDQNAGGIRHTENRAWPQRQDSFATPAGERFGSGGGQGVVERGGHRAIMGSAETGRKTAKSARSSCFHQGPAGMQSSSPSSATPATPIPQSDAAIGNDTALLMIWVNDAASAMQDLGRDLD
jgi:hypothetical protein